MSKNKNPAKAANKGKSKNQYLWFEKPYLIISIFAVIVFIRSAGFGFSGVDDDEIIVGHFDKISSISDIPSALTSQYGFKESTPYYRPVINLSYLIDAVISGKNPGWFHISNLIFHTAVVSLMFFILLKLGMDKLAGLFISLLFLVHPLVTNAVLWIPGRNDLIAAFFCLLSFIYFIKFLSDGNLNDLIFHSLFYMFGIFSKEVVLVLPAACLGYLLAFHKKNFKGSILIKLIFVWLIPIIFSQVLKSLYVHSIGNVVYGVQAFFDNLRVIPEIIFKIFVPYNISVLPTFTFEKTAIGSIFLIVILLLPFTLKNVDKKKYFFGLFWFLLFLLPGLAVVYSNQNEGFDYLDTRAYLPLVGIFFSVGSLIKPASIKVTSFKIIRVAVLVLVVLMILSYLQSNKYTNPEVFAKSAIESNPERPFFYQKLADYYYAQKNYEEAAKYLKETIKRGNNSFIYYKNLALTYVHLNQKDKALAALETAFQLNNHDPELLNALIKVSYDLGKYADCLEYVDRAVKLGGNVDKGFYDSLVKQVEVQRER